MGHECFVRPIVGVQASIGAEISHKGKEKAFQVRFDRAHEEWHLEPLLLEI